MSERIDLRNLPWHALQRGLAEAFAADGGSVNRVDPRTTHPNRRFAALGGTWLDRSRARPSP